VPQSLPSLSAGTSSTDSDAGGGDDDDDDDESEAHSPVPQPRPPTTWHGRLGKRPRSDAGEGEDEDRRHVDAMREVRQRLLAKRRTMSVKAEEA
jgi:hypothetical protein